MRRIGVHSRRGDPHSAQIIELDGTAGNKDVSDRGKQCRPSRFPSLDGWRALSVLLVLGEHSVYTFDFPSKYGSFFETVFDGNLGVRFFFVISGFLITYLLLKENIETGVIHVRRFYSRRAMRILPVYFAFLGVIFALQLFTPFRQGGIQWTGNLTFTTNFIPLAWTTGHLWSLAVEEQFYLLWPILLCLAGLQNTRRILWLLLVPVVMAPICRVISATPISFAPAKPFFQSYSSLNYFDSIAFGCISAVLLIRYPEKITCLLTRFPGSILLAGGTLVIVTQMLIKCYVAEGLTTPLGNTLQAAGFCLLLLLSVISPKFFRPLNWAPVRQIGVLSYSIYIWQMLFCTAPESFGMRRLWFFSFHGWWWATLLVALCSYYCFERPLTRLRARFRPISAGK